MWTGVMGKRHGISSTGVDCTTMVINPKYQLLQKPTEHKIMLMIMKEIRKLGVTTVFQSVCKTI